MTKVESAPVISPVGTIAGYLKEEYGWKDYEKILFRFFFIYLFIQVVPLDWKYFRNLFSINWLQLQFSDIFYISRYTPQFFDNNVQGWGLGTFQDWGIILVIAIIGTSIWTYLNRQRKEYQSLYYWLRVLVRYRLAVGIIAYGFIKLFPLQAPFPSISNLNTNYGDFEAWKLFAMSLGIVPSYESFLGLIELSAGILLLFRRTTIIGLFVIIPFTGNVFMSNLAYEGGEYVYSFYLIVLALFLLAFDAQRIFSLLTLEQPTLPNQFRISFRDKWKRNGRLALKSVFIFFFVFVYGYKTYSAYQEGPYHYPKTEGLADAAGIYNVTEFKINNEVLPYSPFDKVRWKDVVFEKWATLSIRTNQSLKIDPSNKVEEVSHKENNPSFEVSGSGGRHYYSYTIDSKNKLLILINKNKNYYGERMTLHYERPTKSQIILTGKDQQNNEIKVVLDKIQKKYLLEEVKRTGRGGALKL